MVEKRKIFQKGNFKKFGVAATVAVAALFSAAPQQMSAQDRTPEPIEKFDLSQASEGEKEIYKTMVNVLNIKLEADSATRLATRIMVDSRNFSGEQANRYIQAAVELAMGDEYQAEMSAAREVVGLTAVDLTEIMKKQPKTHNNTEATVKEKNTPQGRETVTTTVDGNRTITTAEVERTINILALPPEQKAEYDMILAKIKTAAELNKRRKNSLRDENTALNVFVTPEQLREKALQVATRGVLFRDVDAHSFVAYSEKSGEGIVFAPNEKREKEIRKEVKKAGGMESFVKAEQKKKVKQTSMPSNTNIVDFGRM